MANDIKLDAPASAAVTQSRMTYEEFLNRPDDGLRADWVDGEVIPMSPVSDRHADVAGFLTALLRFFAEVEKLGNVRSAFQMKTGPDLPGREPDVTFIAKENRQRSKRVYLEGPADIAVEIISRESRGRDRGEKFFEYEQGGVREYWLIDPDRKRAEFYLLGADHIYQPASIEDGIFRSGVLPGLWLQVDWLWQEPMPPLMSVLKEWKLV